MNRRTHNPHKAPEPARKTAATRIATVASRELRRRSLIIHDKRWISAWLGDTIRAGLHERCDKIKRWLRPGAEIDEVFFDARLVGPCSALPEAALLLWLGDRAR